MNGSLRQLVDLTDKANREQMTWIRHILTLSAGALALLVALGP